MPTVRDIIEAATIKIGARQSGEPLDGTAADEHRKELNRMLTALNTNSANIFTRRIDTYTMTANKQSYTIGDPSGTLTDLAGVRPARIEKGGVNLFLTTSPVIRVPIDLVDDSQWADIRLQAVYTYPRKLYYDGGNYDPSATPAQYPKLYFYPIPAAAYQWEMYTWNKFTEVSNLSEDLILPDGYEDFIVTNLAVRLCEDYQKQPSQNLLRLANDARAAIQSMNVQSPLLGSDPLLTVGSGRYFNWLDRSIR